MLDGTKAYTYQQLIAMTLAMKNEADVGQRSKGYGSDVTHSLRQQPKPRGHKQSWEIRQKALPQVMMTDDVLTVG